MPFRRDALLTRGTLRHVTFFDEAGDVVVVRQELSQGTLERVRVANERKPHDAHQSISLGIDPAGRIHLAYGAHYQPLLTTRSRSFDLSDGFEEPREQHARPSDAADVPRPDPGAVREALKEQAPMRARCVRSAAGWLEGTRARDSGRGIRSKRSAPPLASMSGIDTVRHGLQAILGFEHGIGGRHLERARSVVVTSAVAGSRTERRTQRRRLRLLFLAQCLKSIAWGLTFQWKRLQRDWRLWRCRALIERSQQFDKDWYRARNPDVAKSGIDPILHYLRHGAAEGRDPHPLFDTSWYLARYPDVQEGGANPLVHFLEHGTAEGRDPGPMFSSAWVLERDPRAAELGPLRAYLRLGRPRERPRGPRPQRSPGADVPETGTAILNYRRARRPGNRIVAFTAITGNYDTLRAPRTLDPDIDYVCFSDTPRSDLGLFEIRPLPFRHDDPVRAARFVKTHPHLLFPDHDTAIWMDATIVIASDVKPLIARLMAAGTPVGGIPHPRRHDVYDEAYHCARCRKDDLVVIAAQAARYLAAGVPKQLAVSDTSFMIWNLRHAAAARVLETWWGEIASGSRRDQISFNYALWRHGQEWLRLFEPKPGTRRFPGLVLRTHVPSDGRTALSPPDVPARVIDPRI